MEAVVENIYFIFNQAGEGAKVLTVQVLRATLKNSKNLQAAEEFDKVRASSSDRRF